MSAGRVLLVEDGANSTAIQTVRPLAAAGYAVGLAAPVPRPVAAASRAVTALHRIAPPGSGEEFVTTVRRAVEAGRYDVVLGIGDAEVMALSAARDRLGGAVFPYAPHDVVVRALDKAALTAVAAECGVGVPVTAGPADLDALPPGPVVVKAAAHWTPGRSALRRETARFASLAQARPRVAELGADAVVQEALPGALTAYVALRSRDGRVLAELQQRGTRIWPIAAGNTARGFSEPVDRDLADRVGAMLARLGWVGLAQCQFVEDARGAPRLVDLNGRCYGALALATKAGVNFPALWVADALGRAEPAPPARTGVRYQRLEDDLRRALRTRPGRGRDVAATLATAFVSTHGVWSPTDPMPALRRLRQNAGPRLVRALSSGRRNV